MADRQSEKLNTRAMTALMAAVLAVTAPFVLPLGPVPLSLGTLVLYLSAYVLGGRRAATAAVIYLLLGAAGMPVFGGFAAGAGILLGPTGGYLMGYPLLALGVGRTVRGGRFLQGVGMVLFTGVLYAVGTFWYCFQSGTAVEAALLVCVLPFLPGDGLKIISALVLGPILRRRLEQAGLLPGRRQ